MFRAELLFVVAIAALGSGGCAPAEPTPEAPAVSAPGTPPEVVPVARVARLARVARGEVRGEVVSIPEAGDAQPKIGIRHEDIAITTAEGGAWSMDSMTMAFSLGEGADLEGIGVGAKIAFTLEVELDAGMAMTVTTLRKLAADSSLTWDAADHPDH